MHIENRDELLSHKPPLITFFLYNIHLLYLYNETAIYESNFGFRPRIVKNEVIAYTFAKLKNSATINRYANYIHVGIYVRIITDVEGQIMGHYLA